MMAGWMGWSGVFSLRLQAIRRFGQTRFDDVKSQQPQIIRISLSFSPFLLATLVTNRARKKCINNTTTPIETSKWL
jgi:hypothetical protein